MDIIYQRKSPFRTPDTVEKGTKSPIQKLESNAAYLF
jgi:hypothetical protein